MEAELGVAVIASTAAELVRWHLLRFWSQHLLLPGFWLAHRLDPGCDLW